MPRPLRSEEELQKAARFLGYEVQQLCLSAVAFLNQTFFGHPINNATLESFLVHYRNVRDFLYPNGPRDDDIIGVDFLPDPSQWPFTLGDWKEVADLEKERLDRALAHLSYSRIVYEEENKKGWPVKEMAVATIRLVKSYLGKVPAQRRGYFQLAEESTAIIPT
jgi:hypothetical protein